MDIDIPGYTLLRTLGKGGMATVYLAQQNLLERKVALKVMSRGLADDPSFGVRFLREAKIVSQLVHPNIVTVHEVGQHADRHFLSMEYIDGHDLRSVRKRLDLAGKVSVIEDIARALHYAGEKGYVHRDIKPENIMFRKADGSAVLTDFGIAKAVKSDLVMTQTGTAIGTPHYMSPEQAKGREIDHRSDLYSLGVVFYLLLVGRVPYDADTAIAIGIKHLTENVPLLPPQYEPLQPVIDGLMAKDPNDRYQSGLHLLNDLRLADIDRISQDELDAEQQPTIAAEMPTQFDGSFASGPRGSHGGSGSKRFTIELDVIETIVERTPRSFLPGFFASLFILSSIAAFIYFARPVYLEAHLSKLELHAVELYRKFQGLTQEPAPSATETATDVSGHTELTGMQPGEASAPIQHLSDSKSPGLRREAEPKGESNGATNFSTQVKVSADKKESALNVDGDAMDADVPSLADLWASIEQIKKSGLSEDQYFVAKVTAHRKLLQHYPAHEPTVRSLQTLINTAQAELISLAKLGKAEDLDIKLSRFKAVFPAESNSSQFLAFSSVLTKQLQVSELLQRADEHARRKHFVTPPGSNAMELLLSAKNLLPNSEEVQQRLQSLAKNFYEKARVAYNKQSLPEARANLYQALRAMADYKPALALAAQIEDQEKRQARLIKALADGDRYAKQGYLYSPSDANAYDAYQYALELDPGNAAATEGLKGLLDKLSVQVWALVGDAKFDQAKSLLVRPLNLMPSNARLLAMREAVEDVADAR